MQLNAGTHQLKVKHLPRHVMLPRVVVEAKKLHQKDHRIKDIGRLSTSTYILHLRQKGNRKNNSAEIKTNEENKRICCAFTHLIWLIEDKNGTGVVGPNPGKH